ncbi:MAG: translation initiation factor IF-2 [Candidatus ainarchaeum sp.]|nr:translation initiation factor IF-2 [Candidatus ainarchaeum sp.]
MIRQPIVCVMGHVDHGKTSLLDKIRETRVAKREAGGITQHIGASEVPTSVIRELCSPTMGAAKCGALKIPGLLFIDTPGHEAFTNLRKRGGSVADFAVLVVDVMQGFQPQALEALKILREYKTPFIVAANKVDLFKGWKPQATNSFLKSDAMQPDWVQAGIDEKLYELVGRLSQQGFQSERFDRVTDFKTQVAIVPVSAKTGEGIAELLMTIAGISQKFLEEQLDIEVKGPGKASILEVKEERGLGKTVDIILYDGSLRKNDEIIFGTLDGARETKVRALLKPKPLDEMRDPREKFNNVDEVFAASGVKIYAPGLEHALAGSYLFAVNDGNREACRREIESEIEEVLVKASGPGLTIKADTLGSVEGLSHLLAASEIPVRAAGIGQVTKKDVLEANNAKSGNRYHGAILAFNVPVTDEARAEAEKYGVRVLESEIIYSLLEDYRKWVEMEKEVERGEAYGSMVLPAKFRILPGCCFRAKSPLIVGVEILGGTLRQGCQLMNEKGEQIGELKSIQKDKEPVEEARAGDQLAISVDTHMTFGRQIREGDVIYSHVPKQHYELLRTKFRQHLSEKDLELLTEIRRVAGDVFLA